jgi:hypothetical protein
VDLFLSGAMVAGYAISGLFFHRFWRTSSDRLFLLFAVAFYLLALQRLGLSVASTPIEDRVWLPLVRLLAFLLILAAIVDKNRGTSSRSGS